MALTNTAVPNRNSALINLLSINADITKSLTRALKVGVNDFNNHTISTSEELLNNIKIFEETALDLIKQLPKPPVPYMAKTVEKWFDNSSDRDKEEFITTEFDNLVVFMSTLGAQIIKHFNLWRYPWIKDIKNGVDKSPYHPEAIALQVIETVWRKVKND